MKNLINQEEFERICIGHCNWNIGEQQGTSPCVYGDLSYCIFKDFHLDQKELAYANFAFSEFTDCTIDHCNMFNIVAKSGRYIHCEFTDCSFNSASFGNSTFTLCTFIDCIFTRADLASVVLQGCKFKNCSFIDSCLEYAEFSDCIFQDCELDSLPYGCDTFEGITILDDEGNGE